MKLLQTSLKVPFFEKYCPLNKKEPAEGLMLGYHWSSAKNGITYLICYKIKQDHEIEESCNFMSRTSSFYVTNLSRLVAMGIAVVEICLYKNKIQHVR